MNGLKTLEELKVGDLIAWCNKDGSLLGSLASPNTNFLIPNLVCEIVNANKHIIEYKYVGRSASSVQSLSDLSPFRAWLVLPRWRV